MELLKTLVERIGVADIIALILILVASWLWLSTGDVPESLLSVTLIVVGFFFGDNFAQRNQARTIEAINPKPAPPLVGEE